MLVEDGSDSKERNIGAAALLSLLTPGLGQAYNAQPGKGLLFFALSLLFPFALLCTPLALHFRGMLLLLLIVVLYRAFVCFEAGASARRLGMIQLRWFNRWYVYLALVVISAGASALIKPALYELRRVELYRLPTPAMSPALLVGDYMVADQWQYSTDPVSVGDIVVFRPPDSPQTSYAKRCVAVGRDTVEVKDGVLFVNGTQAPEVLQGVRIRQDVLPADVSFAEIYGGRGNADQFGPIVVPEGEYFLLGDTRDNSKDSRYFGPVSAAAIEAKALYIYFSWDSASQLPRFSRIGQGLSMMAPQ